MTGSELPTLTAKEHAFVKHVLEGKTYTDAHRLAGFGSEKMSERTRWAHASRMAARDKVKAWLEAAKRQALTERSYGLREHLEDLERTRQQCIENGAWGAVAKLTELLGRASGVYVDRIQTEHSEADIAKILVELGQSGRELAKDLGVNLPDESNNVAEGVTKH